MKRAKTKKILWCGAVILAVMAVIAGLWIWRKGVQEEKEIFSVNGHPVYRQEISAITGKIKLQQREKIAEKVGVPVTEFTWDMEAEGKSGYELLAQEVVKRLTDRKVMQIEAMENGLTDAIDYPSLMKAMEKENTAREESKAKNETVFGMVQYGETEFYDYFNENLSLQNKKKLIDDGVLTATEEEAKAAYDADPEYFGNEEYSSVAQYAKNYVLEIKYNSHLEELGKNAKTDIPDSQMLIDTVREALEGK